MDLKIGDKILVEAMVTGATFNSWRMAPTGSEAAEFHVDSKTGVFHPVPEEVELSEMAEPPVGSVVLRSSGIWWRRWTDGWRQASQHFRGDPPAAWSKIKDGVVEVVPQEKKPTLRYEVAEANSYQQFLTLIEDGWQFVDKFGTTRVMRRRA